MQSVERTNVYDLVLKERNYMIPQEIIMYLNTFYAKEVDQGEGIRRIYKTLLKQM